MLLCKGKALGLLGKLTSKEFLAPLLLLTLLICHGAFGGLHQLATSAAPSTPAIEAHASHAGASSDEGGASDEGLGALGYFATLLSILVAVSWLHLRNILRWRGVPPLLRQRQRHPLAVLPYPRGPSISLLQVLRL